MKSSNNQVPVKKIIIKGGNAPNMVPDYCEAIFLTDFQDYIEDELNDFSVREHYHIETARKEDRIIIKSFGKSAHGSLPENGQNAISQLMLLLNEMELYDDEISSFIEFYNQKIGMDYNGRRFSCDFCDRESGQLTFNVGMIEINENIAEITIDIRYPVTYKKAEVVNKIEEGIKDYNIKYREEQHIEPLHIAKDDPLIRDLMKAYNRYTGNNEQPIAIGGGTYARAINKAVAFGPIFPEQKELAHQADECIEIDNLIKITKIYAAAIIELCT